MMTLRFFTKYKTTKVARGHVILLYRFETDCLKDFITLA